MKKLQNSKKYLAAFLAVLISAGMTGLSAYAKNGSASQPQTAVETTVTADTAAAVRSDTEKTAEKDETVYVIANADGTVNKIIVSDWLRNGAGADTLTDSSALKDIENVRSDAGYEIRQDGALVWDTKGDDLYYQGTGENALPVDLRVTYLLDGEEISAEELAGKSGRVTIRYSYQNNLYQTVTINGKEEKICVPFGMLTGVILDNDRFSNISVSNGKLISDGSRTIAVGFALPGMQDSLAIDRETFELPETVEITADVKNFQLGMTITVAANGLFSGIDTEHLDSFDDLTDGIGQMNDAMTKLIDGSSQLYDGLATLLEKSGELVDGIHQLADGASSLKTGANQLSDGAGELKNGTSQLADGAGTLKNGSAALADGAKALKDGTSKLADGAGTLKNGTSQMKTGTGNLKDGTAQLASGSTQLKDGTAQLSGGLNQLTENNAAINGGAKQVFDTLLSTAASQIRASGLDVPDMTAENYAEVLNKLTASLDADAVKQAALQQVTAGVEAKRGEIAEKVTAAVQAQVQEQVAAAAEPQVKLAVTQKVQENLPAIRAAVIQQAANMSAEQYQQAVAAGMIPAETQQKIEAAVQKTLDDTVTAQMQSEAVQQQIAALTAQNTAEQMQSAKVQAMIKQKTEEQVQKAISDTMAGETVQQKLAAAAEGAASLTALKAQLDSYNTFYTGLQQYTAGVAAAADGAAKLNSGADTLSTGAAQVDAGAGKLRDAASQLDAGTGELKSGIEAVDAGAGQVQDGSAQLDGGIGSLRDGAKSLDSGAGQLSSGAKQLAAGAEQLYNGILRLENGVPALVEGVSKLKDGAMQLSDGLKKFNSEGIQKLADAVDGNLSETLERFRAAVEASKTYSS